MVIDARIPYVLAINIPNFFGLKNNLCAISKVALILWLIFKLDFDLHNDFYWI
jgi:hypothetical protein